MELNIYITKKKSLRSQNPFSLAVMIKLFLINVLIFCCFWKHDILIYRLHCMWLTSVPSRYAHSSLAMNTLQSLTLFSSDFLMDTMKQDFYSLVLVYSASSIWIYRFVQNVLVFITSELIFVNFEAGVVILQLTF